jgi:hypothetical protein
MWRRLRGGCESRKFSIISDLADLIAEEVKARSDLENLYVEYHLIARYYHWSRREIKLIPSKERGLWVDKIIEHENQINSGGDEAKDNPSGE